MSTSTSKIPKASFLAQVQALIAGTQKHTPNGSFTLGGTAYTAASLDQLFQSVADAIARVNAAQASAKAAVSALNAVRANVRPLFLTYKRVLQATYGNDPETLGDYGLQPPKAAAPRTSEQLAEAAVKARATREARGTTSKKQKLAVKGNVTGITVVPTTTQAGPSSVVQQASTAPGATSAPKA